MTYRIKVDGIVQGIGFRPFVAYIAEKFHLNGEVRNSGGIVTIFLNCDNETLDNFIQKLKEQCPIGGEIIDIEITEEKERVYNSFSISQSDNELSENTLVPIDFPMCEKCREELYNKKDRRYSYPFISCVSCGPRYSIIKNIPYDRENTTMQDFEMCNKCNDEYISSKKRRHAQTISCHNCGPQLLLKTREDYFEKTEAFTKAIELLKSKKILAVKGIGGYHFVCSPFSDTTIKNLRSLKGREKKPFAVMFNTIDEIEQFCSITPKEMEILTSVARPIVLLKKKDSFKISQEVCRESRYLGAFLSGTPLHDMLIKEFGPLVFTSANISGNPLIFKDKDIFALDNELLSGVLYNERDIILPLDDSVVQLIDDKPQFIRRAKGYCPLPINTENKTKKIIFCGGGDLKSVFALVKNNKIYLSQYFGDLENADVLSNYNENYKHMTTLFGIKPEVSVSDLHPQYFSSEYSKSLNLKEFKVQHHFAHIASVMAENNINGDIIGFAFDGTGYGTDGNVWGSEVLICNKKSFNRIGHLSYTKMCGGDNSSRDAEISALCYMNECKIDYNSEKYEIIKSALKNNINIHYSSSFSRLFDAVAFITNIKKYNSYEGECAISLENYAHFALENNIPPIDIDFELLETENGFVFDYKELLTKIIENKNDGYSVALGFHYAVCRAVLKASLYIRDKYNISKVALSGGVFQNRLLVSECTKLLEENSFLVYLNRLVPPNDGGIALGQAYIAINNQREEDE